MQDFEVGAVWLSKDIEGEFATIMSISASGIARLVVENGSDIWTEHFTVDELCNGYFPSWGL